jgi:RND family efflux transporter MFP subunit
MVDGLGASMNRQRLRQYLKHGILVAGLAVAVLWAIFEYLRPSPVTVVDVVVREIAPAIQGVGTVEAKVVVQVGAKITGRVITVLVDQGDEVKVGQILARLDEQEHVAAVRQAEAALARARATEALAHVNAERWRQLHAEGAVSSVDMDVRVTEAVAAAHELRNAEAMLALARARLADTVIVNPLDGYVVSRDLEPGATVTPGTAILKIADPQTAWVTVHVDERESGAIAVEDRAQIFLRSLPGRILAGRVARIQRESDRVTEQLAVDITFDERPPRLTLGEQAEAIIRPAAHRAVAVPAAALVRTPDGPGVWTVRDGRLHFRAARFGLVDADGWLEVLDGLRLGEQVVLAPGRLADLSNEGRRVVTVLEDRTTAAVGERP